MRKEEMMEAYLDDYGKITVYLHQQFYQGHSSAFYLEDDSGQRIKLPIAGITKSSRSYCKYFLEAPEDLIIGKEYSLVADYALRCALRYGLIVRTERFDQAYAYDGFLGPDYQPDHLKLSLWAPTASEVKVVITKPESLTETYDLTRVEKGVWRITLDGDYDKAQYLYLVNVNGTWDEAVDPYAYSALANKKAGAIIDPKVFAKDDRITLPELKHPTDAIIYEMNVRDFTKQFNFAQAGKFLGLIQKGLKTPNGKSAGIDYLSELGITHVQLMPVADFTSVDEENIEAYYNWGYDPGHFSLPEGSYSSDPNDPYSRVRELKEAIEGFHSNGIRVILDVVYNHLQDRLSSDFEKIVPNYYFRLSETGAPSNGSFCGNDFDSTRLMSRKIILDSLKRWVKDYDADGFRFDLMGILDLETMNQAERIIHELKPDALLYGEGWDLPTLLDPKLKANLHNQDKLPNIGQFNDYFRDQLKGDSGDGAIGSQGLLTGNLDLLPNLPACLSGCSIIKDGYRKIFNQPTQSINYLECHDGATTWDKMKIANSGTDTQTRVKRQKLMLGTLLVAQGVPFIHSGEEFCRSKQGNTNSYASGDQINQLNWDRKDKYAHVTEYTEDLIKLRKRFPCLRIPDAYQIAKDTKITLKDNLLSYQLKEGTEYSYLLILINVTETRIDQPLNKEYEILANESGLLKTLTKTNYYSCAPLSITILGCK